MTKIPSLELTVHEKQLHLQQMLLPMALHLLPHSNATLSDFCESYMCLLCSHLHHHLRSPMAALQ